MTTGSLSLLNISSGLSPHRMQLVSAGEEPSLYIPPPVRAELSEKVQLVSAGEELVLSNPPPVRAELPEKMQLVSVGEEDALYIPPPIPTAELLEKVQLITTGEEPELNMPPPRLWGQPSWSALPSETVKPSMTALASRPDPEGW